MRLGLICEYQRLFLQDMSPLISLVIVEQVLLVSTLSLAVNNGRNGGLELQVRMKNALS